MATIDLANAQPKLATDAAIEAAGAAALAEPSLVAMLQRKGLRLSAQGRPGGRTVLRLEGKLVAATAPLLKQGIQASRKALHLDIDLAGLAHADGVGLAVLVRLSSLLAEAGGSLRVVNPTPALRTMMTRVNLHHLIDIVEPAPVEEHPAH